MSRYAVTEPKRSFVASTAVVKGVRFFRRRVLWMRCAPTDMSFPLPFLPTPQIEGLQLGLGQRVTVLILISQVKRSAISWICLVFLWAKERSF